MKWYEALPAIGSFLAGPAGGLAGSAIQWLASKFGASDNTVEGIKQTLSGMTSDQVLEAKKLDIEFQKFCLEQNIKLEILDKELLKGQLEINMEEAKSSSLFKSGWRPFVGWVCGIAFAYAAIFEPLMRFIAQVMFSYAGAFPAIDTALTMQVLFGLLGLGAMRSYEKKAGVTK